MRRPIPTASRGIVLRATFLGTIQEIENGFLNTLPRFYPGLYDDFMNVLPEERTGATDPGLLSAGSSIVTPT